MYSSDDVNLKSNNKDQLISYINILRGQVKELQSYQIVAQRVQLLERSHLKFLQYNRRESVEIHGIPRSVEDNGMENYCAGVLEEIGCGTITDKDIHACH